jgi:hypothetical protein
VLGVLHTNISSGKLNYKFNHSGEGVTLATAGLAFIASGSTIASGPYQKSLGRMFDRIKSIMDRNQFQR